MKLGCQKYSPLEGNMVNDSEDVVDDNMVNVNENDVLNYAEVNDLANTDNTLPENLKNTDSDNVENVENG